MLLSLPLLLSGPKVESLRGLTQACPVLSRFLCAMHPSMRQDWAAAWAGHIKPGGRLVTLMFPVNPNKPRDEGPPFPLTPELYTELLTPHGAFPVIISSPTHAMLPTLRPTQLAQCAAATCMCITCTYCMTRNVMPVAAWCMKLHSRGSYGKNLAGPASV